MSYVLQMVYTVDVVRTNVAEALEILADSVLNPRFAPWEVSEQVHKMEGDLKNMKNNPQTVLLEVNNPNSALHGLQAPYELYIMFS